MQNLTTDFAILTINDEAKAFEIDFDIGISYCYPRLIKEPLLSKPKMFLNFHPAPLPEYPGGDPYTKGVEDKISKWAVTCHHMTERYDEGTIHSERRFDIGYPVHNRQEIGAIAHYESFKLFKEVITQLVNEPKEQVCSCGTGLQGKRQGL